MINGWAREAGHQRSTTHVAGLHKRWTGLLLYYIRAGKLYKTRHKTRSEKTARVETSSEETKGDHQPLEINDFSIFQIRATTKESCQLIRPRYIFPHCPLSRNGTESFPRLMITFSISLLIHMASLGSLYLSFNRTAYNRTRRLRIPDCFPRRSISPPSVVLRLRYTYLTARTHIASQPNKCNWIGRTRIRGTLFLFSLSYFFCNPPFYSCCIRPPCSTFSAYCAPENKNKPLSGYGIRPVWGEIGLSSRSNSSSGASNEGNRERLSISPSLLSPTLYTPLHVLRCRAKG